jgi:hypothetical protein
LNNILPIVCPIDNTRTGTGKANANNWQKQRMPNNVNELGLNVLFPVDVIPSGLSTDRFPSR